MAFYATEWHKKLQFFNNVYNYRIDKVNLFDPDKYTTIIGYYYNEDDHCFDVFRRFNKKCPNCKNDIFESSCYKCCHKSNCGKVNYGHFSINILRLYLRFNYESENVSYDTLNSCVFEKIPSKLFHHICNNCQLEFFTLEND